MTALHNKRYRFGVIIITFVTVLVSSLATSANPALKAQTLTQGLSYPWGMTWISDNELIITEKEVGGWIVNINNGEKREVLGWPSNINTKGQGGLLDVVTDPQFEENKKLYFSFSHQNESNRTTTRVASAELADGNHLTNWQVLFTALPYSKKVHHYGSRLAFKDNTLFITVGDRGERHRAQDLSDHAGKLHRIKTDGSAPKDNPFIGQSTQSGETIPETIYSYGHRNPQGLVIDNQGDIWLHEHGPRGGDELNFIAKGENYGWPIITYGKEYWGPSIGEGTHKKGMQQPEYYYVPSIAPSGMIRYDSNLFEGWRGSFLIGSLKLHHLNRLTQATSPSSSEKLKNFSEHRYLEHLDARIRDIEVDREGAIYLLTDDSNGQLIKVTP